MTKTRPPIGPGAQRAETNLEKIFQDRADFVAPKIRVRERAYIRGPRRLFWGPLTPRPQFLPAPARDAWKMGADLSPIFVSFQTRNCRLMSLGQDVSQMGTLGGEPRIS